MVIIIMVEIIYQGPTNVKFGIKEKEIMKLKVTKNLTYPEARKIYDQKQPEFTFAKVVRSMTAKPETKTTYTQYSVEDSKITDSSKVIVARIPKQTSSKPKAQPQSTQNKQNVSTNKSSSGLANDTKQTNKPSTNTKPTNDKHTSKGSTDAVKLHNKFGVFEEADDMELEETPTRPRVANSRSISPVHPPQFPVKPYLYQKV